MHVTNVYSHFCLAFSAICAMSQSSFAETFGKFTYRVYEDRAIVISRYDVPAKGAVAIPNTINGMPVIAIDGYAFEYCDGLTSISLPDSIIEIGNGAFLNCDGLTRFTIPNKTYLIGDEAFYGCDNLTQISLGKSLKYIGSFTFSQCSKLAKITIPEGVTYIDDAAFFDCISLASVSLPSTLQFIRRGAFGNCRSVESILIPNSVTYIGNECFKGCSGLKAIAIPNHVNKIEDNAFYGCTSLECLSIGSGVSEIGDGSFYQCTSLREVLIPGNVTTIWVSAFDNCSRLRRVTFMGNAPSFMYDASDAFNYVAADFAINFIKGKTGFSTPTWEGFPCVAISSNPEIAVLSSSGGELVDNVSKMSFGRVKVGKTSLDKTFTIHNAGTSYLKNLEISKNGTQAKDFIISQPVKVSLAPGACTTFKVRFKPSGSGTRNAAIHIKSNDGNESPFDIKLTGLSVAP